MTKKDDITLRIKGQKILPLFYHHDPEVCIAVARVLYESGIRLLEFTNRGEHALENFSLLIKERNQSMLDMVIGAGTIKTGKDATSFIAAGADFLISPVFDSEVHQVVASHSILWIPGCMTVTEIHQADRSGYQLIKLFPGETLGPGFVRSIMPLFNKLSFIVTGGVDITKENMEAWFKSGVVGVGLGSKLISDGMLEDKDYHGLRAKIEKALGIISDL